MSLKLQEWLCDTMWTPRAGHSRCITLPQPQPHLCLAEQGHPEIRLCRGGAGLMEGRTLPWVGQLTGLGWAVPEPTLGTTGSFR